LLEQVTVGAPTAEGPAVAIPAASRPVDLRKPRRVQRDFRWFFERFMANSNAGRGVGSEMWGHCVFVAAKFIVAFREPPGKHSRRQNADAPRIDANDQPAIG
jgi:hypothetical protein